MSIKESIKSYIGKKGLWIYCKSDQSIIDGLIEMQNFIKDKSDESCNSIETSFDLFNQNVDKYKFYSFSSEKSIQDNLNFINFLSGKVEKYNGNTLKSMYKNYNDEEITFLINKTTKKMEVTKSEGDYKIVVLMTQDLMELFSVKENRDKKIKKILKK